MTTFDLAELRVFTADLDARMDLCSNGEGMERAMLDSVLRRHADLCREFCEQVRLWGRAVFAGRVEFDPEVESLWRQEGARLQSRAMEAWKCGQAAEGHLDIVEGRTDLLNAMGDLDRLLRRWVTPKLAVGPSARQGLALDDAAAEEVRRRIAALPPRPVHERPATPR